MHKDLHCVETHIHETLDWAVNLARLITSEVQNSEPFHDSTRSPPCMHRLSAAALACVESLLNRVDRSTNPEQGNGIHPLGPRKLFTGDDDFRLPCERLYRFNS